MDDFVLTAGLVALILVMLVYPDWQSIGDTITQVLTYQVYGK